MKEGSQLPRSQPVVRYFKSVHADPRWFPVEAVPFLPIIEGLNPEAPLTDELKRLFPHDPWMAAPTPTFVDISYEEGALRPARYGIGSDGSLGDLHGHGFHQRASVMDLVRACQDGMNEGDPTTLVLYSPFFVGGNGIGNLWTVWFENPYGQFIGGLLAQSLMSKAVASTKEHITTPDQVVAMVWVEEQGLTSPRALRDAVDAKQEWDVSTLAKRLRITTEAAELLLTRLGYEKRPLTESWGRSRTFEAKRMRSEWKTAEDSFSPGRKRRKLKRMGKRGKRQGD